MEAMKGVFNLMDNSINKLDNLKSKEIEGELIECPNCKHQFDSAETFNWLIDENGHPTIESLICPKCNVGTEPQFNCDWCPSKHICKLEVECGATLCYPYNDWNVV